MKASFLLLCEKDRWHIARTADGEVERREVAAAEGGPLDGVRAALQELGYRAGGVCLALGSHMVLAAPIDCASLPQRQRRSAMLYRLEEQLPVDIEGLTADFLPPVADRALGVAVETARVRAIIDRLADAGVKTAAVCPLALLALWHACQCCERGDYAIIAMSGNLDVFRMRDRKPAAWYTVRDDPQELARCIQADRLAHPGDAEPTTACIIAEAGWPAASVEKDLRLTIGHRDEESPLAIAARTAERVLAGDDAGWVNLQRDGLATGDPWGQLGGLTRAAVVLGLALLATLAGAIYWRGMQYSSLADDARQDQVAVYRELHPGGPTPVSIRSRLRSERTRAAAVSGGSAEAPRQASALDTLRQIAVGLPPAVRLRIQELRIGPDSVSIEGQVRQHADAESLNRGLAGAGLIMESPRTETLAGGAINFTLVGQLGGQGPAAGPAAERPGKVTP